jgi:hypothetical protein
MREAIMYGGALKACGKHGKERTYKTKVSRPTNECPVCHAVWLSDRLETSLYESDIEDLIKFSNNFKTTVKPSSIDYVETCEEK